MKRVILLRHAKANPSVGESDRERQLNERGITAARIAGKALLDRGWLPNLALVSDAVRTRQTFDAAFPILPAGLKVEVTPALYGANDERMLALIRAASAEADTLLIVGHNPGIGELARRLATHGPKEARERLSLRFPTAGIAVIGFKTELWPEIDRDGGLEACIWADPLGPTD